MGDDASIQSREFAVDIRASIEDVWRAITTPEGLSSWFVQSAKVVPDAGGEIEVDWGFGQVGRAVIDTWEPPRVLRTTYVTEGFDGGEEWRLHHENGVTKVRLVMSIPKDGPWEGEDDLSRGWALFLATMRFVLEDAGGAPRTQAVQLSGAAASRPTGWAALLGAVGAPEVVAAGDEFALGLDGGSVPARTLAAFPGSSLLLAVGADATLLLDLEGDPPQLYALAATYGNDTPDRVARRAELEAVATAACRAVERTA